VIDRSARKKLSESLRHLVSGIYTNDKFDESVPLKSEDRAISGIFDFAWQLYSDLYTHKLTGKHKIHPVDKKTVARCLLFLKSDLEYEWPILNDRITLGCLLSILSMGIIKDHRKKLSFEKHGDIDVWPFIRNRDFIKAKKVNSQMPRQAPPLKH
jgi:hypothetical protein